MESRLIDRALKWFRIVRYKFSKKYAFEFVGEPRIPGFCLPGHDAKFVIKIRNTGKALASVYLRLVVYSPYNKLIVFDSHRDLPENTRTHQLRHKDIEPGDTDEFVVIWTVPSDAVPDQVYYSYFELWTPAKITEPNSLTHPPTRLKKSRRYGRPEVAFPISKRVFLSYARDDNNHSNWVRMFADELRSFGIHVVMDENPSYLLPGDQLREKLQREREDFDFIIPVCSKWYTQKADSESSDYTLKSGVKIETEVFSETDFLHRAKERFLPLTRDNQELDGIQKLPRYLRELGLFYQNMDYEEWRGQPLTNIITKIKKHQ